MTAGPQGFEESPDSRWQGCRVTPGGGNPRESATEKRLPRHDEGSPSDQRGKGETLGSEPTAGLATGPARQAPPGAMPNRGLARGLVAAQAGIPPAGMPTPERPGLAA